MAPRAHADQVILHFYNEGQWPTVGLSSMVGLTSVSVMIGYDCSVHMCKSLTSYRSSCLVFSNQVTNDSGGNQRRLHRASEIDHVGNHSELHPRLHNGRHIDLHARQHRQHFRDSHTRAIHSSLLQRHKKLCCHQLHGHCCHHPAHIVLYQRSSHCIKTIVEFCS